MRYDAHETLVAAARGRCGLFHLVGGLALTLTLFMVLSITTSSFHQWFLTAEEWNDLSRELATASTPRGVLLNLYYFGLLVIALSATLRIVHDRSLRTLIGPLPVAMRQFGRAFVALVLLYLMATVIPTGQTLSLQANLAFGTWLLLLLPALLGLLIQTTAEELLFRGYIQSQLAARFANPAIWILLPAAGFAVLHHDASFGPTNSWLIVFWAAAFGIAAADLTARAGTLGPAVALHLVNNFSAILIAAPQESFDGLALYTFPFSLGETDALLAWAPAEFLLLLCGWLAVRVTLRR
ncbi:type II CAAX prenyl endopeptidase Rce1 family protein [Roseovarius sp. SYSU LYC5161]|uniref:CPBP family glutamic-type intramembrane protease n=1 Tax=Roseovarius halophilus (ex Wu et al. 2025) TaxID=3376060 RepID=UPI0039998745